MLTSLSYLNIIFREIRCNINICQSIRQLFGMTQILPFSIINLCDKGGKMMDVILVLFNQILMMFLLMLIGVWLFRSKRLSLEGSRSVGNILLYTVIPAVVIKAYLTDINEDKLRGLLVSLGLSLLALLLAMTVSYLCFKKKRIENFGAAFCNAGFIGIPLISMLFGDGAVFYISAFVALINIFQWTYGVYIMTGSQQAISLKKIIFNPILMSFLIGLIIFLFQIPIPKTLVSCIHSIAGLNAPLAMFSLGTYLAQISLKDLFSSKVAYLASAARLILIPLLTIIIFSLVPQQYDLIKMSIFIAAATPVGSNVAIFAQLHGQDYQQAVKDVCLSTMLSLATLPLMLLVAQTIWG